MRKVSQVELKRLKKKGKVRKKMGVQAKDRSESVAPVVKESSGSEAAEQPTLISVMGRMADILDRMDKRSSGEPVVEPKPVPQTTNTLEVMANPDRTVAFGSGQEPDVTSIPEPEPEPEPKAPTPFKMLNFEPPAAPVRRKIELESGWQQTVSRDKQGHLSKVEMSAPGTDVRYVFQPQRMKNGTIASVVMEVFDSEGQATMKTLAVNRDKDALISGLSLVENV